MEAFNVSIDQRVQQLKERRRQLEQQYAAATSTLDETTKRVELLEKVHTALMQSVIAGRKTVKENVERVLTEGIQSVHEHKMEFVIKDSTSHGRAGCTFKLKQGSRTSNLLCFGGGIRNIISTILRFVFAEFLRPKLVLPLILDEVGGNISKEYQDKFGQLMAGLSRKFDRQVILISHQPSVVRFADNVIRLDCVDDKSAITGGVSQ